MQPIKQIKDAWLQLHELLGQYTKEWQVRPDIRVTAISTDRNVKLEIGELREDYKGRMDIRGKYVWHSTGPRNVSTLRELANVILSACDFVETSNPEWASYDVHIDPPETFLVEED